MEIQMEIQELHGTPGNSNGTPMEIFGILPFWKLNLYSCCHAAIRSKHVGKRTSSRSTGAYHGCEACQQASDEKNYGRAAANDVWLW